MTTMTICPQSRLFVLRHENGYSCLGFDVVFKRLLQYARMLGLPSPVEHEVGTSAQFAAYQVAERAYIATRPTETLYDPDTLPEVRKLLEAYRKSGAKVRIFLGDALTGQDWLNECDVYGRIGRSTGPLKVPLLVEPGEHGGSAILTACIVRIVDGKTRKDVWRHPRYQAPVFRLAQTPASGKYPAQVLKEDGSLYAAFRTEAKARRWVEFMQGLCMTL
jgi:hypothetical protein